MQPINRFNLITFDRKGNCSTPRILEAYFAIPSYLHLLNKHRHAEVWTADGNAWQTRWFLCVACKQVCAYPLGDGGTGYATRDNGDKVCYACCALEDKAQMETESRITLYLTDGDKVTNWCATLKFTAYVRKGRHNWAGSRYDAWFTDHAGNDWHGVNYSENSQLLHCRKLKARR